LQTDYLDVYQLHWPERKTNYFGQRGYTVQEDAWKITFCLGNLDGKSWKIKHIGCQMKIHGNHAFFESKYNNLPRVKKIQNPYSLLNRL
jgi:aryl-alcohol dehydrogenase-like predicted oxidoreductase